MTYELLINNVKTIKNNYIFEKQELWNRYASGDINVEVISPLTYNNISLYVTKDVVFNEELEASLIYTEIQKYETLKIDYPNFDWVNDPNLQWIDLSDKELVNNAYNTLIKLDEKIKEAMLDWQRVRFEPTLTSEAITNEQTLLSKIADYYRNLIRNTGWYVREFGSPLPEGEKLAELYDQTKDTIFSDRRRTEQDYLSFKEEDKKKSVYEEYKSFSGTDAVIDLVFPGKRAIRLGTITTLSYSVLRIKNPIRTFGRISPRGFTKGSRVIAGSMIFSVTNNHWVNIVKESYPEIFEGINKIKADELPPFDILITYSNEYGATSYYTVYGITVEEEGQVVSIEDAMTENVIKFIARDIDNNQPTYNQLSGSADLNWHNDDLHGRFKLNQFEIEEIDNGINYDYIYNEVLNDYFTEPEDAQEEYWFGFEVALEYFYKRDDLDTFHELENYNIISNISILLYDKSDTLIQEGSYTVEGTTFNQSINDLFREIKFGNKIEKVVIIIKYTVDYNGLELYNEATTTLLVEDFDIFEWNANNNDKYGLEARVDETNLNEYKFSLFIFTNIKEESSAYNIKDIDGNKYENEITEVVNYGYMETEKDGRFIPGIEIKHDEFESILNNLLFVMDHSEWLLIMARFNEMEEKIHGLITRSQAAYILTYIANIDLTDYISFENTQYSDIVDYMNKRYIDGHYLEEEYALEYLYALDDGLWVEEEKLSTGWYCHPDWLIKREELAHMIYRALIL